MSPRGTEVKVGREHYALRPTGGRQKCENGMDHLSTQKQDRERRRQWAEAGG